MKMQEELKPHNLSDKVFCVALMSAIFKHDNAVCNIK